MTVLSSTTHRLIAIITSAALFVVGALPAQAADGDLVIEGTVVFPAGYDPATADLPSMILIPVGSSTRRYGDVDADGRFSITAPDPAVSYHLALDDYSGELYEGWVTSDGSLSPVRADAREFSSSASVTVLSTATSTISGRIVLPAGVTYDQTRLTVYTDEYRDSGWWSAGAAGGARVRPDLTFTVFGLDAGGVYRLEVQDHENVLVEGFVGSDGTLVERDDAAEIIAPATGVTIRPTTTLPIAGHATLPPGFDYASTPVHERTWVSLWEGHPTGPDRWDEKYISSAVADDGSFHMLGARSDREYRLWVHSNHHQYENGWLGPDGELVANTWQALSVSAGATDIRFALRPHTQFSGTVELPESFSYDPEDPPTVVPVALGHNYYEDVYEWWSNSAPVPVAADGSFTTERAHSQTDFRLRLTWPDGREVYWTSDNTVPVADAEKSSTTKPRGDVRFPARNSMVALTAPSISGPATFGSTLRADGGKWTAPSPRLAYQWLRSGNPIAGATAATYKVAKGDIGSRISVKVTASASQFPTASATSSATAVVPKARPSVTAKIVKKGTSRSTIRLKVRVRSGAVSKPTGSLRVKYGKKTRTVKVKAKHKGTVKIAVPRSRATGTITVRFTPTKAAKRYLTAGATTAKVAKVAPKVTFKAPKKVKSAKRVKVRVRVKTSLVSKPTGKIKVTVGKKTRTVKLKAKHKGRLTVTSPRLSKGTYKVRVRYVPTKAWKKYLKAQSSKKATLRVR